MKVHNHLTTASIGCAESKTETINTSGTFYGLNLEAHIRGTGTGSVFGLFGVGLVASGFAETGGTAVKIKVNVDGVLHYINAYTG